MGADQHRADLESCGPAPRATQADHWEVINRENKTLAGIFKDEKIRHSVYDGGNGMRQLKLFISYSHADLEPHPVFKESRIGQIMKEVKHELKCHSSRPRFKILRDVEIMHVSDNFRQKIQQAIADCDMAIVFLSEDYCISEECEAELVQLIEAEKPLFLVETEPPLIDDDRDRITKHRAALQDILYAKFWGTDNNQKPIKFGHPMPDNSETRDKYEKELDVLVTGIKERAARLARESNHHETNDHETNGDETNGHETNGHETDGHKDTQPGCAVFIACPTSDVKPQAMRLATAVEADRHSVRAFDMALDVGDDGSFSEALSNALAQSEVYVQLLGVNPGRPVPGTDWRLVRAQYETAMKANKPTFIWRSADLDIEELAPDYAAFLKEITPVCQIGTFVEFEEYLKKKLNDVAAPRRFDARRTLRLQEPDTVASWPFVAIDAAPADRDLAQKIADALEKYVNVGHLEYDLTGQTLADAVIDNHALIFAYGQSIEGRKRTQAHFKLIRRPKDESSFKGLGLAVGNGAPQTAPPCPRGPNVHVITVADEVDSAAMSTFLKTLGVSIPQENEAH
jgi:TIR domain